MNKCPNLCYEIFSADKTVAPRCFVTINDNKTVTAAKEGEEILGYCVHVDDAGFATVKLTGYVEAPNIGVNKIGTVGLVIGNSPEKVVENKKATKYRVIYIGKDTIGFFL